MDDAYTKTLKDLRVSKIAKETVVLLQGLNVPVKEMYSSPRFYKDAFDQISLKKSESMERLDPNWQTVVIAGIPFYLDH